jgi:hypothetical protein
MDGGFRTWEIESLKVQSPLSRAAFFVPISVWKCAKLELRAINKARALDETPRTLSFVLFRSPHNGDQTQKSILHENS